MIDKMLVELTDQVYVLVWWDHTDLHRTIIKTSIRMNADDVLWEWSQTVLPSGKLLSLCISRYDQLGKVATEAYGHFQQYYRWACVN